MKGSISFLLLSLKLISVWLCPSISLKLLRSRLPLPPPHFVNASGRSQVSSSAPLSSICKRRPCIFLREALSFHSPTFQQICFLSFPPISLATSFQCPWLDSPMSWLLMLSHLEFSIPDGDTNSISDFIQCDGFIMDMLKTSKVLFPN